MTRLRFRWRARFPLAALAALLALITSVFGPVPARAQTTGGLEGTLHVIWGDPRPGAFGGTTLFNLTTADGRTRALRISPAQQSTAIQYFQKRVVVQGREESSDADAPIMVDSIALAEPDSGDVQPQAVTTRRVLYILVKFKGDTQTPHPPNFFKNLTNPLTPPAGYPATINAYFNKASWAKLRWLADVAGVGGLNPTQWFTLPRTKTQYANCGWNGTCAQLNLLANDAMNLAVAAGVNVSVYRNINIVVNNDLDCCA